MPNYQGPSRRKISGGLRRKLKAKKLALLGGLPTETTIGERKLKKSRTKGGNVKFSIKQIDRINVFSKATEKVTNEVIEDLESNPASRAYSRKRIITKGAILKTDLGLVEVTNRPGADTVLNGILVLDEGK